MSANAHALWFTQMIEYEVPSVCQHALAQALVARSEVLATRCEGLQGVSIQASDDGSRVLQYLQWQSRQACELDHCQHRFGDAADLCGILVLHHPDQCLRHDLPGNPVAIRDPAAFHRRSAFQ